MSTLKNFFTTTILGLICLNAIAMEDQDLLANRTAGNLDNPPPIGHTPAQSAPLATAATPATATPAPATLADSAATLGVLERELTTMHRSLHELITYFNLGQERPRPAAEGSTVYQRILNLHHGRPLPRRHNPEARPEGLAEAIKTGLIETRNSMRQFTQHYNDKADTAELEQNIPNLHQMVERLDHLRGNLRGLFNTINPIADRHQGEIDAAQHTLATLHDHFNRYTQQEEAEGDQQTPMSNADRNLTQEISAFFLYSGNQLQAVRQSIDTARAEINALSHAIFDLQESALKPFEHVEELVIKAKQAQEQTIADSATHQINEGAGFWTRKWASAKKAVQVSGSFVKRQAIPLGNLFFTTMLPHMPLPIQIPQRLTITQNSIEQLIPRLDEIRKELNVAWQAEHEIINNIRTLCMVLNNDTKNFHIHHLEEVEHSLATTVATTEIKSAALQIFLKKIAPTAIDFIPTPLKNAWKRISSMISQKTGIAPATQPEETTFHTEQTLDAHYTNLLIRTENPKFLLYDIAARTRFNTGRFSYVIKPMIHEIEKAVGGPLRYIKKNPDDEEWNKYPEKAINPQTGEQKIDPQTGKKLVIRKHVEFPFDQMERPVERYNTLMKSLADESTPLEHPWLLFFKPTPWVVRGIENILCTADPALSPAPKTSAVHNDTDTPFTSTSLSGFVWSGLKKMVYLPTRAISTAFGTALKACKDWAVDKARIITEPFMQTMPARAVTTTITDLKDTTIRLCTLIREQIKRSGATMLSNALDFAMKKTIDNLKLNLREGHPASESISALQKAVQEYKIEGLAATIQAFIANNHQQIRSFAKKYQELQRIDPIIPQDPTTQTEMPQEATIKNDQLRRELDNLIHGWKHVTRAEQPRPALVAH